MAIKKYSQDAYWGNLPDELTPVNVSVLLQLSESNVYKKLNAGELPGYKLGDSWRITREDLKTDIESRKNDEARLRYLLAEIDKIKKRQQKKIIKLAQ